MSEALDWNHGVFQGAALKSEATAAAEHKGKVKFRTIQTYNQSCVFVEFKSLFRKVGKYV